MGIPPEDYKTVGWGHLPPIEGEEIYERKPGWIRMEWNTLAKSVKHTSLDVPKQKVPSKKERRRARKAERKNKDRK